MVYLQTSLMTIIQPDSRLIKTHLSSVNNVEQARTNVYLSLQFDDMPGLGVYHQADGERPQQSLGSISVTTPGSLEQSAHCIVSLISSPLPTLH